MPTPKSAKKKENFIYEAPNAQSVFLAGTFNGWGTQPIALKRQKNGAWKGTVALEPGTYEYRFVVDGIWCDDPQCSTRVTNPFGAENCVRIVADQAPPPLEAL